MNSIVNILGASKIFIPLFQGTVALHRRVNELAVIAKLLFVCLFVCLSLLKLNGHLIYTMLSLVTIKWQGNSP